MSEETPFKSIKITLSEEAIRKLSGLRKGGSFRSDSATIEECIRTTFDISEDIFSELEIWNEKNKGKKKVMPIALQAELLKRVGMRLDRFGDPRR